MFKAVHLVYEGTLKFTPPRKFQHCTTLSVAYTWGGKCQVDFETGKVLVSAVANEADAIKSFVHLAAELDATIEKKVTFENGVFVGTKSDGPGSPVLLYRRGLKTLYRTMDGSWIAIGMKTAEEAEDFYNDVRGPQVSDLDDMDEVDT